MGFFRFPFIPSGCNLSFSSAVPFFSKNTPTHYQLPDQADQAADPFTHHTLPLHICFLLSSCFSPEDIS